jgi:hypothetical protein
LNRQDSELVEPMKPAWRVDIAQWESEYQTPRQCAEEAGPGRTAAPGAAADHMITAVDGLK